MKNKTFYVFIADESKKQKRFNFQRFINLFSPFYVRPLLSIVCLVGFAFFLVQQWAVAAKNLSQLSQSRVAKVLAAEFAQGSFPKTLLFQVPGLFGQEAVLGQVVYSLNSTFQQAMERLFQRYDPDYGMMVALEPKTGRIVSLINHPAEGHLDPLPLVFQASFPSASLFKIVTATAAIESQQMTAETLLSVNGRHHTLYRRQVFRPDINRWTRFMTLKEAFAHSINSTFGKLGVFTVGATVLRDYAQRFGFNREWLGELPIQMSRALVPEDAWGLAESASGFTQFNTLNPVQGALIAAAVINEGKMPLPFLVDQIVDENKRLLYQAHPQIASIAMNPETAREVRKLMQSTIHLGTSRKAFRGFFKKEFAQLDVGGKTGSLTGLKPPGKYDWFVGYAEDPKKQLAIAVLTIHKKYWTVRSAELARKAVESYFRSVAIP